MKNNIEIENLRIKEKIENRDKRKLRINEKILYNEINNLKIYKEIKNGDELIKVVDIKDIRNIEGFKIWLGEYVGVDGNSRKFKWKKYEWVYGEFKLVTYRELNDEEDRERKSEIELKSRYNYRIPNRLRWGLDMDWVKKEYFKMKKEVGDIKTEYHKNWWIYKD